MALITKASICYSFKQFIDVKDFGEEVYGPL